MRKKPLTSKSGKVKELTGKDIRAMRPANEALPAKLLGVLPKRKIGERGPQKEPIKILISLRYSSEVVEYFKNTGQGWQARINNVLKKYVNEHPRFIKKAK